MVARSTQAGVVHMLCHNYRRIPAVMLAQAADRRRDASARSATSAAPTCRTGLPIPKFPLVWRLDKTQAGSGALGDIGAHVVDLARYLVGEIAEVSGDLETFIKERPLPTATRPGAAR